MDSIMRRIQASMVGSTTREVFVLTGISIGVRVTISIIQIVYGLNGLPWTALSTWGDYYAAYAHWLAYVQHGLLPYRDFYTYKYTPLFLYVLYPFYAAGGAAAASIPIVVSDAGTAVLVYLIVKRFARTKIAFSAGLLYALSPFVLYYEDYLWLSSQPMTFFMILAVYFLNEEPVASMASLAVAAMFKQEALFMLPALLIPYAKTHRMGAMKGVGVFVAILVGISLPFLIIAPRAYLYSLNYFPFITQVLNLGPPEKAQPIAAGIANFATAVPNPLSGCGITTIVGRYTGTLCGSIVDMQQFMSSLVLGRLDQIAYFLSPILLALLAPALYVVRRSPTFVQMLSIFSLLAAFVAFSSLAEPYLAYYFVPVYGLIFASAIDSESLSVAAASTVLSLVVPEGPFQVILPLGSLFVLVLLQDPSRWKRKVIEAQLQERRATSP